VGTILCGNSTRKAMTIENGLISPGNKICDRFLVKKYLGKGSMACVYLVADLEKNNSEFALKLIHPHCAIKEHLLKRFLREIRVLHLIRHANVLRCRYLGWTGNSMFYCMDYAPGVTLESLEKSKELSLENIYAIIIQLCDAVAAIHEKAIIHRDIKPSNIIVLPSCQIKIVDFGAARTFDSELTSGQSIIGSIAYLAPEIWHEQEADYSSDLYSMGIVIYELLCKVKPFNDTCFTRAMWDHLHTQPQPLRHHNSTILPWLDEIVLALLEKRIEDRPKSAQKVLEVIYKHTGKTPQSVAHALNQTKVVSMNSYREPREEINSGLGKQAL